MITTNLKYLLAEPLNESYDMKPIAIKQAKELISKDYSEASSNINKNYYIYRGQKDGYINSPFISKPSYRISANTSNVYTRLLSDILPSWKEYPKRNHSFICTNNITYTKKYGSPFFVLPKNSSKIAFCPESDIWKSFSSLNKFRYTLNIFNDDFISFVADVLNTPPNIDIYKSNKIDIIKFLNEINNKLIEMIKNNTINDVIKNEKDVIWINYIIKNIENKDLITILDELFNPDSNGFYLSTVKEYSNNHDLYSSGPYVNERELWFDNEALFIPVKIIDKVI